MEKKTAVIIDDEIPTINMMESIIVQDGRIENIVKFSDAELALSYCLENYNFDIAFVDIDMPFINGIDFARRLNDENRNFLIVYTTAYSDYAKQAYDVFAVGYLNKPLSLKDVSKLLDKFWKPKSNTSKRLDVTVMGTCKVEYDGEEIDFRTKKSQELFFYLLDNEGDYVSSDKLMDALWGDEHKNTRDLLYSNMHYCRKAFKDVGLNNIIENRLGSYRVNKECIKCDYYDLQKLICECDRDIDISYIEKIIKLLKGHYLASYYYNWSIEKNHLINNAILKIYNKYKDQYNTEHKGLENILKLS